jgi:hypothetical protein
MAERGLPRAWSTADQDHEWLDQCASSRTGLMGLHLPITPVMWISLRSRIAIHSELDARLPRPPAGAHPGGRNRLIILQPPSVQ